MKRFFLLATITCSMIFLSACQFFQTFMIVNDSKEEIEVQYGLKDSAFQGGKSEFRPETTSLSNLKTWRFFQKDWEKIPAEQYTFDKINKTFKVNVKPYQVIKIAWADTYDIEKDGDKSLDLRSLIIKGENKELLFEDSKKLFEEFKKKDFQITYR